MSSRQMFRWLLWGYIPFLMLVLLLTIAFCAWVIWVFRGHLLSIFLMLPIFSLVILIFIIAVLAGYRMLKKPREEDDPLTVPLLAMALEPLGHYVTAIAEQQELPKPDRYELSLGEVASVYEDDAGKNVLRIDGLALACIPKKSLLAVIAHELAHFEAGDTRESRSLVRYGRSINEMEQTFSLQKWLLVNPLTWVIRGYHQLLILALSAASREQEFAADSRSAELLGPLETAKALVLIESLHRIPWLSLESIGTSLATHRSASDRIFEELRQRMKSMSIVDWEEAFVKAWKQEASVFDSHPTLKARVKALGIKRKIVMAELGKDTTPPLSMEMPAWPGLEKKLTNLLVPLFEHRLQVIAELGQMIRNW